MYEINVLVLSVETDEWLDLGHKSFRGLPRTGGVIEMEKNGRPFFYRVLSINFPTPERDGQLLVQELASEDQALEFLLRKTPLPFS